MQVEIVRNPQDLTEWYKEHDLKPDENGVFTELPYGPTPVEKDEIVEHVRVNAQRRDVKNLTAPSYNPKTMVFVAGGPSLAAFLDEVREKCQSPHFDVYTSNATCKYLLSQGITPQYHVIIDPTERKKKDLDYDADVTLILGLQCHPAVFEAIGHRKAFKFLAASATDRTPSDVEVAQDACTPEDPDLIGIGGGSMMGTRAVYLASSLGYRRIEYYGFDGCVDYRDGFLRCYAYDKHRKENVLEVEAANGRKFYSTIALARQADELVKLMDKLPGMDIVIHGDSFLSNQVAMYKEAHKPAPYRVSPDYLALQRQMHADTPTYGRSGHIHAPRVFMAGAQVLHKVGVCAILDYGCGKETLDYAMRKSFPALPGMTLRGYDPCIPGKDAEPEPAEIVVCTDVLEHIELECVDNVIKHIHDLTKQIAILGVSLRPATKNLPDGRNAHICLKDKDWWLSYLRKYFLIVECSVEMFEMVCVVQPLSKSKYVVSRQQP